MEILRRLTAAMLALVMVVAMLPVSTLAEEIVGDGVLDVPETVETESAEIVETVVPDGPSAAETEPVETATTEATVEAVKAGGTFGYENKLTWSLEDGVLTISGEDWMDSTYKDEDVPWHDYRENITTIVITYGVKNICDYAFSNCMWLQSVEIPDSVLYLGYDLFENCAYLKTVELPDSVTEIPSGTFQGCSRLTDFEIPETIQKIGHYAFMGCYGLRSITIPYGVKNIYSNTFSNCINLFNVEIPETVTMIDWRAFENCASLKSIEIPDGITKIEEYTFSGCTSLTHVVIPDSVTIIKTRAFDGCSSLRKLEMSRNIVSIEMYAFNDCTLEGKLTIPDTIETLGAYCFGEPGALEVQYWGTMERWREISPRDSGLFYNKVYWAECSDGILTEWGDAGEDVEWWLENESILTISGYGPMCRSTYHVPWGKYAETITSVTIESGVTCIMNGAFEEHINLSKVSIPHTITDIDDYAFLGCTSLHSVTIPEGVTRMGNYVFEGCSSLTSVVIPEGVTEIGYDFFENCTNLTKVTLPASLEYVNIFMFAYTALTDIYYSGSQQQWNKVFFCPDSYNNITELPQNVTVHFGSQVVEETESSLLIFSDNMNMSVNTGGHITLSVGVLIDGVECGDVSGVTIQVMDSNIASASSVEIEDGRCYVILEGHNPGITEVAINDTNTGCVATVLVTVYDDKLNSYTVNNVPEQYIDKYPTNFYNINGLYIDSFTSTENDDGSSTVSFDVYNTNCIYGVVDVFDSNGYLSDAVLISKMTYLSTNIKEAVWDKGGCIIRDIVDGDINSYRQENGFSKKTHVSVKIPKDGYIRISVDLGGSAVAGVINYVDLLMEYGALAGKIAGFSAKSEDFAKDLTSAIVKDAMYKELTRDDSALPKALAKDVAKQSVITKDSMGSFGESMMNNLDSLNLGSTIAKSAANFGYSIAEKVALAFAGPLGVMVETLFTLSEASNVFIQHRDLLQSLGTGSIYIQNQSDTIRASKQVMVESQVKFPSEVALNVFKTTLTEDMMEAIKISKPDMYEAMTKGTSYTYDISLVKNGKETQPDGTVTVYIPIAPELEMLARAGKVKVFRLEPDNTLTDMNAVAKTEDGFLVFDTSHFSLYTIVGYDSFAPDNHDFSLGDVNHDTKINAKDATLILQKSVGVLKPTAKFCEECAEVSGDGKLNAKDSTLILQFSVGLRDSFPAGA